MPDIGYYTLPVILSFQGIDKQVNDALGKTLDQTVPKTINKSVNDKIGKQIELSTKTVGKKIGTTLNTSINPQQVGKDIGAKINTGITTGIDAKKVGTQVSKTVAEGIDLKPIGKKIEQGLVAAQNLDAKKVGKTIGDNMAGGIDGHKVGQVLKDVLREPLNDAKQVAKDWGKQVGNEILSGDVKKAATDVGDVVTNATAGINNLGHVLGVNLDGVEKFGTDTAKTIDTVGSTVQGVVDKVRGTVSDVRGVSDAVKALGSGDVTSRIQGVANLLTVADTAASHLGVDITGVTTPLQSVVGTASDVAGLVGQVRDLKAGLVGAEGAGALGTLGAVGAAAGPVAVTVVGIAEVAAVAIAAKTAADIATFKPEPGAPGTSPALAPEATIPTLPGFPSTGLPPLVPPARPTPRGDFVPAPKPPPPPPGRVPATEIPQPGWTKDPATGTLYTPDGTPVAATPGEYARPAPDYWAPARPTPAPVLAPPSAPAPVGPRPVPGMGEATTGVANIHASSANVSIGSANISGVSIPTAGQPAGSPAWHGAGKAAYFQSGGAIPIIAHTGEHVFTKDDVAAMGGQSSVYAFRAALHGAGGYDEGGEITDLAKKIATPVAEAAAKGAAAGAAQGGGKGMALPGILGGPGGQQMGADVATSLLGIGAGGVGETLGLGTLFPDPMQNPNVKSLIALASAFKGPIMGAMKGKLGIQQPGWKPGMPVAAMEGDTGAGASIGLPFGLPSIDLPNAPEGGGPPPGGGPVGGGDTHIDASLNVHGDVGNEKALRDHQQQIQRGLDRLAPMPTGPN